MIATYEELVTGAETLVTNREETTQDEAGNPITTTIVPTAQNIETAKVLALLAIADRLQALVDKP